jgi:lysyl-tRNA synthetase class 2
MKRLLAAGVGDCYQIAPAFRAGEQGRWHNPEFTLLEWYRLGYDAPALMEEVSALVDRILGPGQYHQGSYQGFFLAAGLPDPLTATEDALQKAAAEATTPPPRGLDGGGLLDWLFSEIVVPGLPPRAFVTGFPAEQAVLARREAADPRVAARFELFCNGVELANGFDELTDPAELRRRLEADQQRRRAADRTVPVIDERLLAAMGHGLPACAGVALGLDRLFALAAGVDSVAEVMAFDWERA